MAIYTFFIGLSRRTCEEIPKSIVEFLVTCLVSEILKDEDTTKTLAIPSWIFKKSMMSQAG